MDFGTSKIIYTRETPPRVATPIQLRQVKGHLIVRRANKHLFCSERVRVGISIRKLSAPKTTKQWENTLIRRTPLNTEKRPFRIEEKYWNTKGITWCIPTALFGTTEVEITLEPSALLATGFILEVFRRDSTIVHEVRPNQTITKGCNIKFNVDWNLSTEARSAKPVVTPSFDMIYIDQMNMLVLC